MGGLPTESLICSKCAVDTLLSHVGRGEIGGETGLRPGRCTEEDSTDVKVVLEILILGALSPQSSRLKATWAAQVGAKRHVAEGFSLGHCAPARLSASKTR